MSNDFKRDSDCIDLCDFVCACISVCITFVLRYEMLLKQSVGTEDLFLGLNGKDPSSMCCEAMLVTCRPPQDFYTSLSVLF